MSEKDIEDYICENIEEFKESIRQTLGIYNDNKIQFIGRQVRIGTDNIADLIFTYNDIEKTPAGNFEYINFVIVELKNRDLEPKDYAQLCRYVNTLESKLIVMKDYDGGDVFGILVGRKSTEEIKEIQMFNNDSQIYIMETKLNLKFNGVHYSKNEDYINNLKLDERIEKIYE